jgi:hypothetical protein
MKLIDRRETVMVVVGGGEKDRAVAVALQEEINSRGGALYRRAVVVADEAYLDGDELSQHPTIAIGGPGVNAVAARFVADVPTLFSVDDESFVQAELEGHPKRVVLWGMNAASTAQAVEMFTRHGVLSVLLERIWGGESSVMM